MYIDTHNRIYTYAWYYIQHLPYLSEYVFDFGWYTHKYDFHSVHL